MKYLLITVDDARAIAPHLPEGRLKQRLTKDTGGDFNDIVHRLKKLPTCMACDIEGQQHDCFSLVANKIGRRLKRLVTRADENTIPE